MYLAETYWEPQATHIARMPCGKAGLWGETMEQVIVLKQKELIRFDPLRLEELYVQLGEAGAENIVCRALEELAARLSHAERCYRERRVTDMRRSIRSLVAVSEQIGMAQLAQVADDVTRCIDGDDNVALAATLSRLLRIGERSLSEIWDLKGLTI